MRDRNEASRRPSEAARQGTSAGAKAVAAMVVATSRGGWVYVSVEHGEVSRAHPPGVACAGLQVESDSMNETTQSQHTRRRFLGAVGAIVAAIVWKPVKALCGVAANLIPMNAVLADWRRHHECLLYIPRKNGTNIAAGLLIWGD